MPRETLTGEFNATNVTFDEAQTPDVENNLNTMENVYAVDIPKFTQQTDNLDVPTPVVPNIVVPDVPVYIPEEEERRHPLTKNEAQHKKMEELDLNQAKKEDGAKNVGRVVTGQDQNLPGSATQTDKENKKFNDLMERLESHRRWLLGRIDALQDEIDALDKQIRAKDNLIKHLEAFKNGQCELDADGYPKDADTKARIKEWERKNGKKLDRNTPEGQEALDAILLSERNERGDLTSERGVKQLQQDELTDQLEVTETIQGKLENGQPLSQNEEEEYEKIKQKQELDKITDAQLENEELNIASNEDAASNPVEENDYNVGFSMPPSV